MLPELGDRHLGALVEVDLCAELCGLDLCDFELLADLADTATATP